MIPQPNAPYNPNHINDAQYVTAYAVPSDQPVSPILTPIIVQGQKQCKNCHGAFTPPPGALDTQDAFYRCGNCLHQAQVVQPPQQPPISASYGFGQVPQSGFYQPPQTGAGVHNSPVIAYSTPVRHVQSVQTAPSIPLNVYVPRGEAGYAENSEIGVCRRCRYTFRRRPGVHDGQAQYYTCEACEPHRMGDMVKGSCTLC